MATKAKKKAPAKQAKGRKAPAKQATGRKAPAKKAGAGKAAAKRAPARKAAGTKGDRKTVEGYVAKLGRPLADVVQSLRKLIHEAAPTAKESIKWAQPVYEANGPFAYIRAARSHVSFGFWRGADLPDPDGILAGGGSRMRHVKIAKPEEIHRPTFLELVRQAVKLNQELGDPTQRRA